MREQKREKTSYEVKSTNKLLSATFWLFPAFEWNEQIVF